MNKHALWILVFVFQFLISGTVRSQSASVILGANDAIVYDIAVQRNLLAATLGDQIQIWNYNKKVLVKSWPVSKIIAIEFSNDKLVGASKEGNVVVWEVESGKEIANAKVSNGPLITLATLDSTSIVIGGETGEIIHFDLNLGKVRTMAKIDGVITALAVGPDSKQIITGSNRGEIAVWKVDGGTLVTKIHGHRGWVRDIKVSGRRIVSGGDDGVLRTWSLNNMAAMEKRRYRTWVLCVDLAVLDAKKLAIRVVGLRNGNVRVLTGFGVYKFSSKAMINSLVLLKNELPTVRVAVGTHGEGIQIMDAKYGIVEK